MDKSSLEQAIKETYGKGTAKPVSASADNDFTSFMKAKPVVAAPVEEPKQAATAQANTSAQDPAEKPAAEVPKETIGYDGKEVYDLSAMATTVTGAVIENPEGFTELIIMGIEWARASFYPGLLYRLMFTEKERDQLEPVLAKFIDVEMVGESDVMIPLRKDLVPTKEESTILIKWRKFVKQLNNLKYSEKERATFANYIHSKVKDLDINSLIARFGPVIGLIVMEAGKVMPFYTNRKSSILNTYTNR